MKALMVAFTFTLPYHVMRTAARAGNEVHVLGAGGSRGLKLSRCCASFRTLDFDHRSNDYETALHQIADACRGVGAEVILPTDDVSTRILIGLRDRLPVPTSALPSLEAFDHLNEKWNFFRLALACGARVPQTWLFETTDEIAAALRSGALVLPLILKPTNLSGTAGVRHVRSPAEIGTLAAVDYRPILVQRFIEGTEVGVNVLCRRGEIVAYSIQQRTAKAFRLLENTELLANVALIMQAALYDGPANLDVILSADTGLGYILECNPRFWYTIFMSMVLGLNFVDMSIRLDREAGGPVRTVAGAAARINRNLFGAILRPWRMTRSDWRMLAYHLKDPLAIVCDRLDLFRGAAVGVRREMMDEYHEEQPPAAAAAD